jgi:hypothetical protein
MMSNTRRIGRRHRRRRHRSLAPPLAAVALATLASTAADRSHAESTEASSREAASTRASSSGEVPARPVAPTSGASPYLPTGPTYFSAVQRPDDRGNVAVCSFRCPVCVHARRGFPRAALLGTLADLEKASALLVDTLGLPAPLADGRAGGSAAFDLYLVAPDARGLDGGFVTTTRDDPDPSFDRASAFALLREDMPPARIRANLVARAFASGIAWGVDAGETPAVRESHAAYLAELVAPCSPVSTELIDDFQAHPERAVTAPGAAGYAVGIAFPWYLDLALGSGIPGAVPMGLAVISGQHTRSFGLRWDNEPDLFDALRSTLKARTPVSTIADFWLDFAVARLFMGSRDDGVHFPETAFSGSAGRVRFDWSVPYASLPRRLSPERPIDPTGATYTWVDLRGAPPQTRLVFRVEWEAPVPFRWALVRIASDGTEASRVLVTSQQKTTIAERNLDALDGLSGVAVVGVNIGDLALDDPFDPDHTPYEPHSYVLTVAAEQP